MSATASGPHAARPRAMLTLASGATEPNELLTIVIKVNKTETIIIVFLLNVNGRSVCR